MGRPSFQAPSAPAPRAAHPNSSVPIAPRPELPLAPRAAHPNSSVPIAPRPELPLAPRAKPFLTAAVIVRTPQMIGGQFEHAATVTRVFSGDVINVILMPDGQEPYPVPEVQPADDLPSITRITWRWPPRT